MEPTAQAYRQQCAAPYHRFENHFLVGLEVDFELQRHWKHESVFQPLKKGLAVERIQPQLSRLFCDACVAGLQNFSNRHESRALVFVAIPAGRLVIRTRPLAKKIHRIYQPKFTLRRLIFQEQRRARSKQSCCFCRPSPGRGWNRLGFG